MKNFFLFLFLILLLPCTYAFNAILELRDSINNSLISDVLANVKIDGYAEKYVIKNGKLNLSLEGKHQIEIMINYPETEGNDYYEKFELDVNDNVKKDVYLMRTATIEGFVKDEFDNLIKGAKLKFECRKEILYPVETDNVGFFSAEFVPVGKCKIFATRGNKAGFTQIVVEHGKLYENVEIILNKKIYSTHTKIIIFIVVVLFLVFVFYERRRIKKSKLKAMISALNEREKKIIQYLIKKGSVSQAKLCKELLIPKTSMIRILRNLEEKGFVKIEKFGRKHKRIGLDKKIFK